MTPQAAQSNAVDINAFFTRILNSLALTLTFPYFLSFTLLLSLSPTHRSCRNNPKIQRHHAECGLGREYLKWSSSSSSNGENRSNERNLSTPSPPTTPRKYSIWGCSKVLVQNSNWTLFHRLLVHYMTEASCKKYNDLAKKERNGIRYPLSRSVIVTNEDGSINTLKSIPFQFRSAKPV